MRADWVTLRASSASSTAMAEQRSSRPELDESECLCEERGSQVAKVAAEEFPETLRALPAFKQAALVSCQRVRTCADDSSGALLRSSL